MGVNDMACSTQRSDQISDFASGRLSEKEADDLLNHILVCSDCSEEFDTVADLVTCVDRHGDELLRLQDETVIAKALKSFKAIWNSINTRWVGIPVPVRVLAPTALAVVLAFLLLYPSGDDGVRYAQLAQFEAPRYIPRSLRGAGLDENIKELFEEGMSAYANEDYSMATEKLSVLTKTQTESGEAYFYLGVSYLLNAKEKDAIVVLRKAADLLAEYPLGELSHWYLGMAYLKIDQGGKALAEFQRVIDLDGVYRMNAEIMIEKIRAVEQ
jgi:tetratricopeptide (TPR) repeat protein